jgi:hypothetical protein
VYLRLKILIFIVEAVAKAVQGEHRSSASDPGNREVKLPLIHSKRPGTLDLSGFDLDELLS